MPTQEYVWAGQWGINAWQNRLILFAALMVAVWFFVKRKLCFFELFGAHFERTAIKLLSPIVGKVAGKLPQK